MYKYMCTNTIKSLYQAFSATSLYKDAFFCNVK